MERRPYSAGLSGVGSVRCDGNEGGEGVTGVQGGAANVDVSLGACEKEGNKIH